MSYETVRRWVNHFGPMIAADLRKRRLKPHTTWHLDEVYLKIDGRMVYLWRAVDAEGEVLDVLVQSKRNQRAALKLMRKLLKKYQSGGRCAGAGRPPGAPRRYRCRIGGLRSGAAGLWPACRPPRQTSRSLYAGTNRLRGGAAASVTFPQAGGGDDRNRVDARSGELVKQRGEHSRFTPRFRASFLLRHSSHRARP